MNFRIGQGIDFHRLEEDLDLWVGGLLIPSGRGSVSHSDGDVLIHAICDALLGAAGLRDIGYHFPDTDEKYLNIDSKVLLRKTLALISEAGFEIVNIDTTVCLENPKLSAYIDRIKGTLAEITGLIPDRIGVKATTTEKMGFTGREEGIIAVASVLLSES
ncbi:MAG TPA: 2-C-methyl-D-erythritol 2,4-cyclodiphosphate synthase [Bacteroidales bacterium]|nr:2-C-methyl-D-erythritol 2,4-cyclodiphosphate synthase [Bacteroidales bacterium]